MTKLVIDIFILVLNIKKKYYSIYDVTFSLESDELSDIEGVFFLIANPFQPRNRSNIREC